MAITDRLRPRTVSRPVGRVAAVAVATGLGLLLTGAVAGSPAAATTTALSAVTFTYTIVGEHAFRIPAGVFSIHVVAIGGKGGDVPFVESQPGGAGARVEGDLAVSPGQILYAEVGGAGATPTEQSWTPAAGGDNGGGSGGVYNNQDPPNYDLGITHMSGGGGGGASDVRTLSKSGMPSSWSLSSRLLVAGGGGGTSSLGRGGDGGNPNGQTPIASASFAGRGATTSTGGAGGASSVSNGSGGPGGLGVGGNAGQSTWYGAGGGGGGYYGGGGGAGSRFSSGGGGGGSSYGPAGTAYTSSRAPASVTISYQPASFSVRLAPASNTAVTLNVSSFSKSQGATIIQWPIVITVSEVWIFSPRGGNYLIINMNSGQCLTTPGIAGHALYQWPCIESANQLWNTALTPGSATPSQIRNPASGLYLQAHLGSTAPGVAIVTEPWNAGSNNQFFYATPA